MRRLLVLREQSGSASIEFAGAMFVFALVMIFILQAGAMMVAQVYATAGAREGARAAVTRPAGDPLSAANNAIPGFEREVAVIKGGDSVTVVVRVKTPVIFNAVTDWNWWVRSSATMRQER